MAKYKKQMRAIDIELAKLIDELSNEKSVTQQKLADALGLSQNRVGMIMRGESPATFGELNEIAEVLGVEMTDLIVFAEKRLDPEPSTSAPDSEPVFSSQPDWSKIDLSALAAKDPGYSPRDQIEGEAENQP